MDQVLSGGAFLRAPKLLSSMPEPRITDPLCQLVVSVEKHGGSDIGAVVNIPHSLVTRHSVLSQLGWLDVEHQATAALGQALVCDLLALS
eukprot:scaffold573_cov414-Prasinococcus_capsulatus_cf.AAC.2